MGTTVSTAITETASNEATSVLNKSRSDAENSSSNSVILSVSDVEGDVSISGNKISLTSATYSDAKINAELSGANKEKILSSAANNMLSKLSGLNLGQTSVSTTDVNMAVNAAVNMTNNVLSKCITESINNVRLDANKVAGNVNIDNNLIRIDSNTVNRCIASNASGITNDLSVETTSTNKFKTMLAGLSGLEILMAAAGALLLIVGPIVVPVIAPLLGMPKNIMRGMVVAGSGAIVMILSGGFSSLSDLINRKGSGSIKNPVKVKVPKAAIINKVVPHVVNNSQGKLNSIKDHKYSKTVVCYGTNPIIFGSNEYSGPLAPIDIIKAYMVSPYTVPIYATFSTDLRTITMSSMAGVGDDTFKPTIKLKDPAEVGAGLSISWFKPEDPPTLAGVVYHVRMLPKIDTANSNNVRFDMELYKFISGKWEDITATTTKTVLTTNNVAYANIVKELQRVEGVAEVGDIKFEELTIDFSPYTAAERVVGNKYLVYAKYLGMGLIALGLYIVGFGDSGESDAQNNSEEQKHRNSEDSSEDYEEFSEDTEEDDERPIRVRRRRRTSMRDRVKSLGNKLSRVRKNKVKSLKNHMSKLKRLVKGKKHVE